MRWLEIAKTEVLEHRRQPWMIGVLALNYVVLIALFGAGFVLLDGAARDPDAMAALAAQSEGAGVEIDTIVQLAVSTFGSLVFTNLSVFVAITAGYSVLHDRSQGTLPFLMLAPITRRTLLVGKLFGAMAIPFAMHIVFVGASAALFGGIALLEPYAASFGGDPAWWVAFLLGAPAAAAFVGALGTVISSLSSDVRTSTQSTSFFVGLLALAIGYVLVDAIGQGVELQLAFAAGCLVLAASSLELGARIIGRDLGAS